MLKSEKRQQKNFNQQSDLVYLSEELEALVTKEQLKILSQKSQSVNQILILKNKQLKTKLQYTDFAMTEIHFILIQKWQKWVVSMHQFSMDSALWGYRQELYSSIFLRMNLSY
jgi:hypothetical protein